MTATPQHRHGSQVITKDVGESDVSLRLCGNKKPTPEAAKPWWRLQVFYNKLTGVHIVFQWAASLVGNFKQFYIDL